MMEWCIRCEEEVEDNFETSTELGENLRGVNPTIPISRALNLVAWRRQRLKPQHALQRYEAFDSCTSKLPCLESIPQKSTRLL